MARKRQAPPSRSSTIGSPGATPVPAFGPPIDATVAVGAGSTEPTSSVTMATVASTAAAAARRSVAIGRTALGRSTLAVFDRIGVLMVCMILAPVLWCCCLLSSRWCAANNPGTSVLNDVIRENVAVDHFYVVREDQDMARSSRHRVVALVGEKSSTFDLSVAAEVFGRDPHVGVPWYRFTVATEFPGRVDFDLGLSVMVDHDLSAFRAADTIIVAGASPTTPSVIHALRDAHRRGVRMVSLCAGTLVLAHAGLLDGRRATTHWHLTGELGSQFPNVDVVTDVLYVDGGGDVLTSAGVAAAIDLAVHVVRLDHGADVANQVARNMVVAPHRHGGQAQFVTAPAVPVAPADNLAATLDWATTHLNEDLSLCTMARSANLSVRQFSRRFQATTGTTPHQWLIHQRVLRAQELLERGTMSIEEVAQHSGFRSAGAMRPHFTRQVTTSPSDYKRSFATR
jgi:transcriptional regulator GlxA family with amidase domain